MKLSSSYSRTSALTIALPLLLFVYTPAVNAIRCYQCNSANNSMCTDLHEYPGHSFPLRPMECVGDFGGFQPFCRKITLKILAPKDKNPEDRVIRSCGWQQHPKNKTCYKADNDDHFETVCQCFHDDCNSAPSSVPQFLFLNILILLLSILYA